MEELARVGELRFELGAQFFTHGVATGRSAGTDSGDQVARAGAVEEPHAADAGFDDALGGAAPAGVEGGNDTQAAIGHQNRDAISGLHSEEQAWLGGDFTVGAARRGPERVGARGADDKVGVDLFEGDDGGCGVAGDGLGQETPVGEDGGAVVVRGKTEIQLARLGGQAGRVVGAVGAAQAAFSGAETGTKPGKIPAGNGEPFDSVGGAAAGGTRRGEFFRSVGGRDAAGSAGRGCGRCGLRMSPAS